MAAVLQPSDAFHYFPFLDWGGIFYRSEREPLYHAGEPFEGGGFQIRTTLPPRLPFAP